MKLLVLFLLAAVWLQLPNGGNAKGLSSRRNAMLTGSGHVVVEKEVDEFETALATENSPEFQAFLATFQRALQRGSFPVGYFYGDQWRALMDILPIDSEERYEYETRLSAFYKSAVRNYRGPYKGKFFESPEWKAYKVAAMKPTFFLINDYSDVTRNMYVAAKKAEMEDKNFRRIFENEVDKLHFNKR